MISNDCFSPHTGEHIRTDNPAPWMARAGIPAPDYDAVSSSAFWRGDSWEIVFAEPPVAPPHIITAGAFRARFTGSELAAFGALAFGGDPLAQQLFMRLATATDGVDLGSDTVAQGIAYLVNKGVLSAERSAEVTG